MFPMQALNLPPDVRLLQAWAKDPLGKIWLRIFCRTVGKTLSNARFISKLTNWALILCVWIWFIVAMIDILPLCICLPFVNPCWSTLKIEFKCGVILRFNALVIILNGVSIRDIGRLFSALLWSDPFFGMNTIFLSFINAKGDLSISIWYKLFSALVINEGNALNRNWYRTLGSDEIPGVLVLAMESITDLNSLHVLLGDVKFSIFGYKLSKLRPYSERKLSRLETGIFFGETISACISLKWLTIFGSESVICPLISKEGSCLKFLCTWLNV